MEELITGQAIYTDGWHYYDKNGNELFEGDTVLCDDGNYEVLYATDEGHLGIDATNPLWIKQGRAVPCEYGVYPLNNADCKSMVKVEL